MAPRRSYRKSTRGCTTCKSRRVKCDEVHPECGNCKRRGNKCSYTASSYDDTSNANKSRESNVVARRQPTSVVIPQLSNIPAWDSQENRLLEMRLMAHCTRITHTTMSAISDEAIRKVWLNDITELAFQNDPDNPLLDILLGVAARHLQLLNPEDQSVASRSVYYHSRGLEKCNRMLSQINEKSCLLVFASSILIALHLVLQRHEKKRSERYQVPIAWFQAMRGIHTIATLNRPWIMSSNLRHLLYDWRPLTFDHEIEDSSVFKRLLVGLETHPNPTYVATYEYVVKYLHWIYTQRVELKTNPDLRKDLLAFPGKVPELFLTLMGKNDPRALVITAHFFALLRCVKNLWWLEGVPECEMQGLLTIVPTDWMWAMEWPIQQFSEHRGLTYP